jgi:microcystin-dependent protein
MAAVQRVEVNVSFTYEATISEDIVLLPAPHGTPVTIIDRNTQAPTSVYLALTGGTPVSSLELDAGGGLSNYYVVQGSYTITALPSAGVGDAPAFGGSIINWEAVRGDGVENYYPNSITHAGLGPACVDINNLAADVLAYFAQPAGVMTPFAGSVAPTGWLFCDGSSYSTTDSRYANLYNIIGTTYGGSGTYFKVPDCRGRTLIGAGAGAWLTNRARGVTYGSESHTHTTDSQGYHTHSIESAGRHSHNVTAHNHTLSGNGHAQIHISSEGQTPWDLDIMANRLGTETYPESGWRIKGTAQDTAGAQGSGWTSGGVALGGSTDSGGAGSTDSQGSHTHVCDSAGYHTHTAQANTDDSLQPSLAVPMIIKM